MPIKLSTLTLLLAGLVWLGPGLQEPASAKGLLSFGKKKETVAPAPPASGGTVYLTKYGPLTAAQYRARLKLEQEKVNEAVRRAAERKEVESRARQKAAERAAREETKAAQEAAEKAAEERARADRHTAKEREAEEKRAEQAAKNLAAQKSEEAERARAEEADRAHAEDAESKNEKKRLEAMEVKALKIIEEQEKAARRRASASAELSPEARISAMERIARDLAALRKKSTGPSEIASASSLGLTDAGSATPSSKTPGSGSKIDSLNRSIFAIVLQRKAAVAPLKRVEEGDLYLTTKQRTPFYYFNPLQLVVPDLFLSNGTRVALLKRGKIWSDVRLEDGKEGIIANDFLVEAPAVESDLPVDIAVATSGGDGSGGFQYTAIPKDFVPPELPLETDFEDRMPSPLLLPPLPRETETP